MKKLIAACIILTVNIAALSTDNFPKLNGSEIPGAKITREQIFDGSGLWGYINGGADIFLEYGFENLLLQEIEIANQRFKVEFYRMNSPESAFGIYSASHYRCGRRSAKLKFNCMTDYQIQFAKGNYYVSIINMKGTAEEQKISGDIFDIIISKIDAPEFVVPQFFAKSNLLPVMETLKHFKGILGIQNGVPEWYDYFEKYDGYGIYLLPVEAGAVIVNTALVKFKKENDADNFIKGLKGTVETAGGYKKISDGNISRIVKRINGTEVIFMEGSLDIKEMEKLAVKILQD
ncbi:MAG TPA: hypothetical protein PLZ15_06150 [Melioribacteraceae bacterium]|nr:hypothetical protein [Melioribacteraceae bacterium]